MSENVIDLSSRKPLNQTIAEKAEADEDLKKANIDAHLEAIDNLRRLVADGQVEGLILLGRHNGTGLFYQDCIFPMRDGDAGCSSFEALTYAGALDVIRMQFVDLASWAPCIMPDGSVERPEEIEENE